MRPTRVLVWGGLAAALAAIGAWLWPIWPGTLLVPSILLRLGAVAMAVAVFVRWRNASILLLAVMFLLMALRQVWVVFVHADPGGGGAGVPEPRTLMEIPGFLVTLLAIVSIVWLARVYARLGRARSTEQALHASERRRRSLTAMLPVGVFVADGAGLWTETNERFCEMTGRPAGELLGPGWLDSVSAEDRARVESAWSFAVEKRERFELECSLRRPDATRVFVYALARPERDARAESTVFAGTWTDITERKQAEAEHRRLEAQLRHSQKLESLGVLAGGIAHDFNNLLVGILGNASLVADDLPAGSKSAAQVAEISRAAQRAADLANQMLAYSGRGKFEVGPVDLNAVVEEMVGLASASVSKRARLDVATGAHLPFVEGDPTQLRQVVMNLVTNAAEAVGDRDGRITVTTSVERVGRCAEGSFVGRERITPGDYVCLAVEDTGCGIDAQTRPKIFDPFFTTKFAGRGLGLATVLGIVRSHRGLIGVDSTPRRGTRIRVLFRATGARAVPAPGAPGDGRRVRATGTVLVVDDEELVRTFVTQCVERAGMRAIVACDGIEAAQVLRQQPEHVAAAVLDMTMPRRGGDDALRDLRAIQPGLGVVLTSGYSEEEVAGELLREPRTRFLQKPFRPEELTRALDSLLDKPRS